MPFVNIKILMFMYEGPISSNKENKNVASPCDTWKKKISYMDQYKKININISSFYIV